ncbi:FAD/NAD(P)-binding domain-containing protein [Annulohypoxylon maeteangense]|uniref:FAD/NAD(P)-binding domain-containing protein n=1 Tax=Annulohypoxylon maeteangense TaxID=1927788 RepID=UPI00200812FD|nr:FAD/NAD(P)-binding domain-containing protein [Annulohypoxylon maeteangense]KAI0886475.1 FAD/NAD(P)-binding domain-containing protein [Annulohypoxylon maeteangense]
MTKDKTPLVDALIVGGSHAGLSAALTLYRALHTTVIFDDNKPRNHYGTAVRHTSTWEGKTPDEMREASRKELLSTGLTTFVDRSVETLVKTDDGIFEATDDTGAKWRGRKLLLATGSTDVFPDIDGYQDLYTRGIYPCMFQFGYELRGSSSAGLLAVDGLAQPMFATMLARDAAKSADEVTIYTNGNGTLAAELSASQLGSGVFVDDRPIARLSRGAGALSILITFTDGTWKTEDFVHHRPLTRVAGRFVEQLGLALSETGDILAPLPFCRTSVEGVYAAGDCASLMKIIPNAVVTGAYAGCGMSRELPKSEVKGVV